MEDSAAPGTTITVRGLSEGKAIADQYRYLEHIDIEEVLDNGRQAERKGYTGFSFVTT